MVGCLPHAVAVHGTTREQKVCTWPWLPTFPICAVISPSRLAPPPIKYCLMADSICRQGPPCALCHSTRCRPCRCWGCFRGQTQTARHLALRKKKQQQVQPVACWTRSCQHLTKTRTSCSGYPYWRCLVDDPARREHQKAVARMVNATLRQTACMGQLRR